MTDIPTRPTICIMIILAIVTTVTAEDGSDDVIIVCQDAGEGGLEGFPDVCRINDGRLMTVFYAGYEHVSPPNEVLPRGGRIHSCFSEDEGRTWSNPQLIYDGPIDDRDPSIVQLKDGRLLCTFFHSAKDNWRGTLITISHDNARTWSEPQKLTPANYFCSTPIRVLSSGRLILPLYKYADGIANGAVMVSDDEGMTWSRAIDIDSAGQFLDAETDIIELTDGRLYAVERGRNTQMHFAISSDKGQTWSQSKPIGFMGICPYLLRATNGIVVMVYGQIGDEKPNGTVLRYSMDECQSWSQAVPAAKPVGTHPSMVNLKDGSILLLYYDEGAAKDVRARRFKVSSEGIEWP